MNENLLIEFFFSLAFTDVKLRYCEVAPGGSCCNQAMEHKMALHARQVMDKSIRDSIQKMSQVLSTRSQKFNGKL